MTAREAAIAAFDAAVAEAATWCGPFGYPGVGAFIDRRDDFIRGAIIAALDTPTTTETGTYPCCNECGPGCSGRHESRCHCQTAELLAIADEGAARARGEGL